MDIPRRVGGAEVFKYSEIDSRHKHTKSCNHDINGKVLGKAKWGAICKYENSDMYYLFFCYEESELSDTVHESMEEAMEQAEFEYEGIRKTWKKTS